MYEITLFTFILGPVPQQNSLMCLEKFFILRLVHLLNFTLLCIQGRVSTRWGSPLVVDPEIGKDFFTKGFIPNYFTQKVRKF